MLIYFGIMYSSFVYTSLDIRCIQCMYVCMYDVCMYVCMGVCMYVCILVKITLCITFRVLILSCFRNNYTIDKCVIFLFQIWAMSFLLIVLASIGILCIETVPSLRVDIPHRRLGEDLQGRLKDSTMVFTEVGQNSTIETFSPTQIINSTNFNFPSNEGNDEEDVYNEKNFKIRTLLTTTPHPMLEQIDTFCTCFFTVEFLVRLCVAPDRMKFWKSAMNIIDVLCVLPMWIKYIMLIYEQRMSRKLLPLFFLIMILRVLRICRVLRMAKHYTGVKILVLALKASLRELGMLVIFIAIVVLIFSVIIYYAEFFVVDTFDTIPNGFWWAIITLTTVGYGDMYPKSGMGYVVGAMCALTGILATGLPVPIIANNFNLYYAHAQLKEALGQRKCNIQRRESMRSLSDAYNKSPSHISNKEEPLIIKEAAV